jgi:hypothetical protein
MKDTGSIELTAFDPLLHNFALPLRATLYPLGFPLEIHTNSPEILEMVEESWGACVQKFAKPPIEIRIAVSRENASELPSAPVFRAQGHLLSIVSDAAHFAMCDLAAGFAFCWLTQHATNARVWTRHYFLDAMVYCSLNQLYVTAVHAGCIAKNRRGVLLCGPSGVGKSVLALACARNGWSFVTDDVAYLVRGEESAMVLGKPDRMKFLTTATALFPNLEWPQEGADHAGSPFLELRTEDLDMSTAPSCSADFLVFLRRPKTGPARLIPISSNEALIRLLADLPIFEEPVHAKHRRSIEILSRVRAYELEYEHLAEAIPILSQLAGDAR